MKDRPHNGQAADETEATHGFLRRNGSDWAILLAAHLGPLVSTTHAIGGALVGVGTVQRFKAVCWGVASNILWAWILTIPASGALAAIVFAVIRLLNPHA